MATQSVNINATATSFNLTSKWRATTGSNGTLYYSDAPTTATHEAIFGVFLPAGATVKSAYIHSEWGSPKTGYAIKTVNGTVPDASGNVNVSLSGENGAVSFEFKFKANGELSNAGSWSSAVAQVSNVYLHIEYDGEELSSDTVAKTGSTSASTSEQLWCKGTGAAGQAWAFTISGLPSGAVVTKATLAFHSSYTYDAPGYTRVYWGTSTDGTVVYAKSGSVGGDATADLTKYVTGNGSYSLYFHKTANSGGTQSNVYFTNISVTVSYTYYVTYEKPTAPTNVKINGDNSAYVAQNGTATLSWSGGAGATNNTLSGYKIYCNGSLYSTQGTNVSSLSIPAKTAGTYLWTVRTAGENSDSSDSEGVYCYSYSNPVAPTSVTVEPSTTAPGGEAVLSWSGESSGVNNPIVSFSIYRAESASGTKTWQASSTDYSYTVTAPDEDSKAYYYTIVCVGTQSSTYSGHSAQAVLWAYEGEVFAPTNCVLDGVTSHEGVTMSWDAAREDELNPILGYEVQRCESEDCKAWDDWAYVGETSGLLMTVNPPENYGNWYQFRVRTKGTYGVSDWTVCRNKLRREHIPFDYEDAAFVAKETPIKAQHMTELQTYANGLLKFYNLGEEEMTAIVAGETSLGGWTEHVMEIRDAIDKIPADHQAWKTIAVNCPKADVMQQLRDALNEVEKPAFILGKAKLRAARL